MLLQQLVECVPVNYNPGNNYAGVDTWSIYLRRTCSKNDFESFRKLIRRDESLVNSPDERGATPLFYACFYCCEEMVEFLLEKGASVRVKDKDSWTPLKALMKSGMPKVSLITPADRIEKPCLPKLIRMLLEAGADPNSTDNFGQTIWIGYMDIIEGNPQTIRLLFEYGLDVNLKVTNDKSRITKSGQRVMYLDATTFS